MPTVSSITHRAALLLAIGALAPASAHAILPGGPAGGGGGGDVTPPETQIDSGPAADAYITTKTPAFTFSASEAGWFLCRLDEGTWSPCTSPLTLAELSEGKHTLRVAALDQKENGDPSPATRTFTVDTLSPAVLFTDGPAAGARVDDNTPTYGLSATDASPLTVQCQVDGAPPAVCTGLESYTPPALADGTHTITVRATDAAGNHSSVSRTVTVETKAPAATAPAFAVAAPVPAAAPAPRTAAPKTAAAKKKAGCSRRALKALKTKKARRAAAKRCAAPNKRRK